MRNIFIIFKRELKSYFNNPLAYVLIIIFSLLSMGLTFVIGDFLELTAGPKPGVRVVLDPPAALKSGSKVAVRK